MLGTVPAIKLWRQPALPSKEPMTGGVNTLRALLFFSWPCTVVELGRMRLREGVTCKRSPSAETKRRSPYLFEEYTLLGRRRRRGVSECVRVCVGRVDGWGEGPM